MQKSFRAGLAVSIAGIGLLGVLVLDAFALDLSARPEAAPVTSVSDIQSGNLAPAAMGTEGLLQSQSKLQSLEYRPTAVAEIQGTPSTMQPVTMTPHVDYVPTVLPGPTPTYMVFPVLVHDARDKAFSDLPIMMSSAVANQLSRTVKTHGYSVLNPIYAYDALREKGVSSLYQNIMRDYVEAGQPNERDIEVLADQLSTKSHRVNWVIFVEAGFDTDHTWRRSGLMQKVLYNITDISPSEPNYFLNGAVKVFNIHDTAAPIWTRQSHRRMSQDKFGNFTKSVFDDGASVLNFRRLAVEMATQMIGGLRPPAQVKQSQLAGAIFTAPTTTPEDQEALKNLQE